LWCLVLVSITAGVVQYWDSITPYIPLPMFHKAPVSQPTEAVTPSNAATATTTTTGESAPAKQ